MHRWSQCTNASDRFTAYIDISDTSIIVPVYLYNFFFVNLVFFVLGGSLLDALAVFAVLSSIDESKDESYREQQKHQSRIIISSNQYRSHLENYRSEEVSVGQRRPPL